MNKGLMSAILSSREKIDLLMMLQDGPKEKKSIMEVLGISSQKLTPLLRELTDSKVLVIRDHGYALSTMGNLLATEVTSTLDALEFFDHDYWWDHDFDFVPLHLMRRLYRIRDWTMLQDGSAGIYDYNQKMFENCLLSNSVNMFTAVMHPRFLDMVQEMADKGVSASTIFDPDLFEKIKENNAEKLQKLISNRHCRFYVHSRSADIFSFLINDSGILLRPLKNDGTYDHTQLLNSSQEAVRWGRELFEHCLENSEPITGL